MLPCLREPIPEIFEAARHLDAAVSAHLAGKMQLAAVWIRLADMPEIRAWTESLWGKNSPYVVFRSIPDAPIWLPKDHRVKVRMPTKTEKDQLRQRDGYHCRFCGIPVIRQETRPDRATRFIETTQGILSYFEIASLLAEQVLVVESRIYRGDFSTLRKVPYLGTFFLPYKPNALILK